MKRSHYLIIIGSGLMVLGFSFYTLPGVILPPENCYPIVKGSDQFTCDTITNVYIYTEFISVPLGFVILVSGGVTFLIHRINRQSHDVKR
jgi:hypothetical protein